MSAVVDLGLDIEPDRPHQSGDTEVTVSGSWEKLQCALNRTGKPVALVEVQARVLLGRTP